MKNNERKKLPWMAVLLVIGHLAIIAGLAVSASAPRRPAIKPSMSILEGLRETSGGLLDPQR